ncbi:MAG: hypothetical protein KC733_01830, partial [Candidatus Omnitrophica bacterium]|nr:hypothetical protein [Candidatus Omnitrophota bacterium]
MLKRIRTGVVISILSVFLFLVCAAIYLITTLRGAELFVRWVVPHYIQAEKFNYQQIKGNLREGIEVAAIECSNLVYFPKDNSLRIQKISIGGLQWDLNKIKILVENARISLPSSDPIILSGYFQDQTMQAHIFSKWLSIEEMMGLFHNGLGKGLQGDITQIDLKI